jgi:hypothetical protein
MCIRCDALVDPFAAMSAQDAGRQLLDRDFVRRAWPAQSRWKSHVAPAD